MRKEIIKVLKKNSIAVISLFAIFIIANILRVLYLPCGALSFAYDQARDAFIVQDILKGDFKILGPPVSGVPGLYHGVLYYYVIAPAYLLGHGNPITVAYFLSLISSLGVFSVFYLTYLLTKKIIPGILAALIFAFSFEATQYANLLTNASMGVWFVPIVYIGLYLWIKNEVKWGCVITGIAFGLAVQSEIALAYHLGPILLWLYLSKKKINKKELIISLFAFILAVFPMVLSEVKFGFKGFGGLFYLFSSKDGIVQKKQLSDLLITFFDQSGKTFAYTIFPLNVVFGGLVGFYIILFSLFKNNFWSKFLATYMFAYLIALPFGGWNMRHILVGVAPAIAVMVGIFSWKYFGVMKYFFVVMITVILISNLSKIIQVNKDGQVLFLFQDMSLSNEIDVINYTYEEAGGEPFSISTLTSPLFVNTTWSYLYNRYGLGRYGYLPSWVGRDQIGLLGNNLTSPDEKVDDHFFILEPTYGIPDIWVGYARGDQDAISILVNEESFGDIVVQKRKRNL